MPDQSLSQDWNEKKGERNAPVPAGASLMLEFSKIKFNTQSERERERERERKRASEVEEARRRVADGKSIDSKEKK